MADTETTGRACPTWMKALLIVSLAANIAVVGLYVGYGMQDKPERSANRAVDWIVRLMPEERRDFVQKAFDARRDELREARAGRARRMQAILAAMRAEPFSPEALAAELRRRGENRSARDEIIYGTLTEVLTALSPDERMAFVDNLEAKLREVAERRRASN